MFGKMESIYFCHLAFANLQFKSKLKPAISNRYWVKAMNEFTKNQRNFVEST